MINGTPQLARLSLLAHVALFFLNMPLTSASPTPPRLTSRCRASSEPCFRAWPRLVENPFHAQAHEPLGALGIRQDVKPSVFDSVDHERADLLRFHPDLLDALVAEASALRQRRQRCFISGNLEHLRSIAVGIQNIGGRRTWH